MAEIKSSYTRALMLTNDLIGGKWKVRILWHIIHSHNRYSILQREIPEISHKVLSSQLKELVESGLIDRIVIDDNPPKVIEYSIREEYFEIIDLIENLYNFTTSYAHRNGIEVAKA